MFFVDFVRDLFYSFFFSCAVKKRQKEAAETKKQRKNLIEDSYYSEGLQEVTQSKDSRALLHWKTPRH